MVHKGIVNKNCIKKDLDIQKNSIFDYVKGKKLFLLDFVSLHDIPADKSKDEYLIDALNKQDICIVSHPLVLGGSVTELLNIMKSLLAYEIKIIFVECQGLSTDLIDSSLLCNIYESIIEVQKDIISYRTKLGLKATKQKGVKLGRPKGSKNKTRFLDEFKDEILDSLNQGVSSHKILVNINNKTNKKLTYPSIKYFIDGDKELSRARDNFQSSSLLK